MFIVLPYTPDRAEEWNCFVAASKNATFLFDRGYMDYHANRFEDHSLMVYNCKGQPFALLPANIVGSTLYSHQGLTYGGLIIGEKATAAGVCEAMTAICDYLRSQGITKVIYKTIPWIYPVMPSDEPLYALTEVCSARLVSRDIASVVNFGHCAPVAKLRLRGEKKAMRHAVHVENSDDFAVFWAILTNNLREKYASQPVHTLDEMMLLKSLFPDHIRLIAAFEETTMVAGTVLYITPQVVKTQYISASPRGKEVGALDMLFLQLLTSPTTFLASRPQYFDMGTSALDHSTELRLPLIFQKEGFGARAVCFDTYEWTP